jgi:uncharacterized protein YfdQ (DUF2303 family)
MTKPATLLAEPLSLPNAIADIEALTRKSEAKFEIMALPDGALPKGLAVTTPSIGVKREAGGITLVDLAPYVERLAGKPVRRKGTAMATTLGSFIDLTVRHKALNSVVFADANWKAPKFTAVIDYHTEVAGAAIEPGDDPHARFGQHRIVYTFPLSEAWKVWIKNNAEPMGQAEFAAFIENHIVDLASPNQIEINEARDNHKTTVATPAELIELSRGMEVTVGARIKSKTNLASGEKQLVFETENRTADGSTLVVPGLFVVNVAPFYQGEPMRIFARLRYRPSEGGVVWFYELYRPDLAIEERVTADLDTVRDSASVPVFHGAPEI